MGLITGAPPMLTEYYFGQPTPDPSWTPTVMYPHITNGIDTLDLGDVPPYRASPGGMDASAMFLVWTRIGPGARPVRWVKHEWVHPDGRIISRGSFGPDGYEYSDIWVYSLVHRTMTAVAVDLPGNYQCRVTSDALDAALIFRFTVTAVASFQGAAVRAWYFMDGRGEVTLPLPASELVGVLLDIRVNSPTYKDLLVKTQLRGITDGSTVAERVVTMGEGAVTVQGLDFPLTTPGTPGSYDLFLEVYLRPLGSMQAYTLIGSGVIASSVPVGTAPLALGFTLLSGHWL